VRCLLAHRWGRKRYDGSDFYFRKCEKCGAIQRGIYNVWEPIRDRAFIKSEQIRIVRQRSSWLDRLTHTLRLRRTRIRDRAQLGRYH